MLSTDQNDDILDLMEVHMQSGPRRIADKMSDKSFVDSLPKSREEALQKNLTAYLTKPCKHGHYSYRNTKNGGCAMCISTKGLLHKQPATVTRRAQTRWNSSDKAKTAKDKWKQRNPKWAWVVSAVGGARTRAKYKNLAFDLTNDYVYTLSHDLCPIFCEPLSYGGTGKQVWNSASLDRIDPKKGYVQGNVAVISFKANTIKSNATSNEIFAVARWLSDMEQKSS
jgi:hypothetical protein